MLTWKTRTTWMTMLQTIKQLGPRAGTPLALCIQEGCASIELLLGASTISVDLRSQNQSSMWGYLVYKVNLGIPIVPIVTIIFIFLIMIILWTIRCKRVGPMEWPWNRPWIGIRKALKLVSCLPKNKGENSVYPYKCMLLTPSLISKFIQYSWFYFVY